MVWSIFERLKRFGRTGFECFARFARFRARSAREKMKIKLFTRKMRRSRAERAKDFLWCFLMVPTTFFCKGYHFSQRAYFSKRNISFAKILLLQKKLTFCKRNASFRKKGLVSKRICLQIVLCKLQENVFFGKEVARRWQRKLKKIFFFTQRKMKEIAREASDISFDMFCGNY